MINSFHFSKTILITSDTLGGVWNYVIELIRHTKKNNIRYILATMGAPLNYNQKLQLSSLNNVILAESDYKLEWMENPWDDIQASGKWLLQLCEMYKPDLVHLNDFSHASLDWGLPVIVVAHSCVFSWFNSVYKKNPGSEWNIYRDHISMGLSNADIVVAPSRFILSEIRKYYDFKGRGLVIYNGRDINKYRPGKKQPIVFSAGRIWDDAKNIEALSKAASGINWEVYIAGDNKNPDTEFRTFDNVIWTGLLNEDNIVQWLSKASIYALPAKYEPFGLSILEAALCGCALVLGDISSLREIWNNNAIFVRPDNPAELQTAINRLIENESERYLYSRRAVSRAKSFSSNAMANNYMALYKALLNNNLQSLPQKMNSYFPVGSSV